MYGIMDLGYASTKTKNGAGATTNKTSGMVSGVQSGSLWGLKGTEDLGGGLTVGFKIVSAIGANTGTSTGFARRSVLKLSGGFGKVGLGRDYTPTFSLVGATDALGTDASTTASLFGLGVRADNMFTYTSPTISGVTAKIGMIGNSSGAPGATNKAAGTDLAVTYAAGPLMIGLGHGSVKATAAGVAGPKTSQTAIDATYDMGMAKVYFNNMGQKVAGLSMKVKETNLGCKCQWARLLCWLVTVVTA